MRKWIFTALLLAVPSVAICADDPNPMSTGDLSCTSYLAMVDDSAQRDRADSWAAGRVSTIVPAVLQPELRKTSMVQFRSDLRQMCASLGSEATLFDASAILAYRFEQERA